MKKRLVVCATSGITVALLLALALQEAMERAGTGAIGGCRGLRPR